MWGCTSSIQFTHSFESPWFRALNLKCDDVLVSIFAFKFNLYRYKEEEEEEEEEAEEEEAEEKEEEEEEEEATEGGLPSDKALKKAVDAMMKGADVDSVSMKKIRAEVGLVTGFP
jgi:hypothetical protein